MKFRKSLTDGSEPEYAPCTSVSRQVRYWKCPKKYRDLGFKPTNVALGKIGEASDMDMAREARRLTCAMIDRYAAPDHPVGTWAWLINRYLTDRYSPFHKVKANTRESYVFYCRRWERAIGKLHIGAMTYEEIMKAEQAMKDNGRSASNIKRMFTHLRIVAGYGKALRLPEAREVADTMSEMKFSAGPRRNVHPTRAQIRAIIDEADARGLFAFATGLLIQWTYLLRAVDVRGQWLKTDGRQGGIVRNGQRWQDGLTWDMFEDDLSSFEKVISKTAKSNPEAYRFEVTDELRGRLRLLGSEGRIGPVIVSERYGAPYTRYSWSQTFRRLRDALDMPKELTLMDTRAGGITEARMMGADPYSLRDAAGHSNLSTTDRYARGRSEGAAKVIRLRNA